MNNNKWHCRKFVKARQNFKYYKVIKYKSSMADHALHNGADWKPVKRRSWSPFFLFELRSCAKKNCVCGDFQRHAYSFRFIDLTVSHNTGWINQWRSQSFSMHDQTSFFVLLKKYLRKRMASLSVTHAWAIYHYCWSLIDIINKKKILQTFCTFLIQGF